MTDPQLGNGAPDPPPEDMAAALQRDPTAGDNGEDAPPDEQLAADSRRITPAYRYTVGEKIGSLLDAVFNNPDAPGDPRVAAVLRAFRTAQRFGMTKTVTRLFPPLDDEAAWHEWLALAVGVCLNLTSDGVQLDVEACRRAGAEVLAQLFD